MTPPRLRTLRLTDLDRVLQIDAAITGVKRKTSDNDLWSLIAETTTCFGAEVDGRLAGFVLADIRPWEFGSRTPVGWIIALGVDPKQQGKGIGRQLGQRVLEEFRRLGVDQFKTLVDRNDKELYEYFQGLGLVEGSELVLTGSAKPSVPRVAKRPLKRAA